MAVVTLHSGRVVNVTPENLADVTNEDINAYKADGVSDVESSGLGAAIQEALSKAAGVAYDTSEREAAVATAARVLSNPFVQAADALSNAKGLTNYPIFGGGSALSDFLAMFARFGQTAEIALLVGGGVLVVGGVAFIVWKVRAK